MEKGNFHRYELTILSIFRDSQSYLARYLKQVEDTFGLFNKPCRGIWLEGDSNDATCTMLLEAKKHFETLGHCIDLIKFETNGPYWPEKNVKERWRQLASCWNTCLKHLSPSKICICVESDLLWEPNIILELASQLDEKHRVICPMLFIENSEKLLGDYWFYDTWGFSRENKRFHPMKPYWPKASSLMEEERLLELSSGGGMLVASFETMSKASWDESSCILQFAANCSVFMDKTKAIFHPEPAAWSELGFLKIRWMRCKGWMRKILHSV